MLPQRSHITKKRGVFYFRRRLPVPLNGEVALSLRTRNFREAEFLAAALNARLRACVDEQMTDYAKITAILRDELDRRNQDVRTEIIQTPFGQPILATGYAGVPEGAVYADLEVCDEQIGELRSQISRRDLSQADTIIRELMAKHGIPQEDFQPFGLACLDMLLTNTQQLRDWISSGPLGLAAMPGDPAPGASVMPTPAPPSASSPKLSTVLVGFIDLMKSTGEWKGQTEAQNTTTYAMFMQHCGDQPVQSYTRKDCAAFFDVLRALPALYAKKAEWRGMTLAQIAEMSRGLKVDRLSMKTIKRHFSALGRLFDYLKKRGEYEGENPAHGHDFPSGKTRANQGRKMWEGEKLTALFASPVWTGCASASRRSTPGTMIIKDEKYWLPLLGLYHGNRLEEFAQLIRSDVRGENGIWYFDINDADGKQIKNTQSARRVPIHPKIIALGFLDYVRATAPKDADRLFPNLIPGGADEKYGHAFTKWFSRYRKEIGLYEKGLDYHSFRHGVTTKLFGAGVEKVVVDALTGHEGAGISEKVYLKQLPLETLYAAICKVEWPEVLLDGR